VWTFSKRKIAHRKSDRPKSGRAIVPNISFDAEDRILADKLLSIRKRNTAAFALELEVTKVIIAAVRGNNRVVVWLTEKATFTHIPFNDIYVWWGSREAGIELVKKSVSGLGFPVDEILFIEGVNGIAAINLGWDGSDTFFCEDSNCKVAHSVDQLQADQLFQTAPPEIKCYEHGLQAFEAGDYEEAVRAFNEVVRLEPDFTAHAWERLGFAYHKLRHYDQAVMAYRKAIHLKPDFSTAWYNIGLIHYGQGHHTEVMQVYEKLKTLDQAMAEEFFRKCVAR
jgi:tetratricopeptide (TPR) repeat protein